MASTKGAEVGGQGGEHRRGEGVGEAGEAGDDLIDRCRHARRQVLGEAHRAGDLRHDRPRRLLELVEQEVDALGRVVEVLHRPVEVLQRLHQLVGAATQLVEGADHGGDRPGDERDEVVERLACGSGVSHGP